MRKSLQYIFAFIFREGIDHISFNSMESTLNKVRQAALPKTPSTIADIDKLFKTPNIHVNYGMTKRTSHDEQPPKTSQFYDHSYECADFAYCVFSSKDVIKAILDNTEVNERKLFADATFKICPIGPFKQVLIVFGELLGHVSATYCKFSTGFSYFVP